LSSLIGHVTDVLQTSGTGGKVFFGMTDRGLLEGIGTLHELTHLSLNENGNLTAQALSKFLHRRSVTSIVSLNLSLCFYLDDEGLTGIAERCNQLTYLHVAM
jgi:hypothetical protein